MCQVNIAIHFNQPCFFLDLIIYPFSPLYSTPIILQFFCFFRSQLSIASPQSIALFYFTIIIYYFPRDNVSLSMISIWSVKHFFLYRFLVGLSPGLPDDFSSRGQIFFKKRTNETVWDLMRKVFDKRYRMRNLIQATFHDGYEKGCGPAKLTEWRSNHSSLLWSGRKSVNYCRSTWMCTEMCTCGPT